MGLVRRNPFVVYTLITFVVSWSCFFLAAFLLGWPKHAPSDLESHPLFLLGVFGPALVALVMTMVAQGPDGRNALLASLVRFPRGVTWYAFALSFFFAIRLLAALLDRLASGSWPARSEYPLLVLLGATIISTPVQVGEELGWRGYALPHLGSRVGLGLASLVVGVNWALWHLPQFIIPGTSSSGQSFPVFTLSVIPLSVAMAWLYWRSKGSLPVVMLMHAAVNNLGMFISSSLRPGEEPLAMGASRMAWITGGLLWLAALFFLWHMRSARFVATQNGSQPRGWKLSVPS